MKSCPFCGKTAKVISTTFGDNPEECYRVECEDGHSLDAWTDTEAEAEALWDQRTPEKCVWKWKQFVQPSGRDQGIWLTGCGHKYRESIYFCPWCGGEIEEQNGTR